jgi:hypothetical protein
VVCDRGGLELRLRKPVSRCCGLSRLRLVGRVRPSDQVRLGHRAPPSDQVRLGHRARPSDQVRLGHQVRLGNRVRLGGWVRRCALRLLGGSISLLAMRCGVIDGRAVITWARADLLLAVYGLGRPGRYRDLVIPVRTTFCRAVPAAPLGDGRSPSRDRGLVELAQALGVSATLSPSSVTLMLTPELLGGRRIASRQGAIAHYCQFCSGEEL